MSILPILGGVTGALLGLKSTIDRNNEIRRQEIFASIQNPTIGNVGQAFRDNPRDRTSSIPSVANVLPLNDVESLRKSIDENDIGIQTLFEGIDNELPDIEKEVLRRLANDLIDPSQTKDVAANILRERLKEAFKFDDVVNKDIQKLQSTIFNDIEDSVNV